MTQSEHEDVGFIAASRRRAAGYASAAFAPKRASEVLPVESFGAVWILTRPPPGSHSASFDVRLGLRTGTEWL